jgi:hypothetical protein
MHLLFRKQIYNLIPSAKLVQCSHTLLVPFGLGDPESLPVLHDISQHGTSEEDHVFSPWGVLDTDLEVLRSSAKLDPLIEAETYL